MKNWIKTKIRQLFFWIFKEEVERMKSTQETMVAQSTVLGTRLEILDTYHKKFSNMFENIDVSVDHHYHGRSWAVISLQGVKSDYIKFVDLGDRDIREIAMFLSKYDRAKVDAAPGMSAILKFESDEIRPPQRRKKW